MSAMSVRSAVPDQPSSGLFLIIIRHRVKCHVGMWLEVAMMIQGEFCAAGSKILPQHYSVTIILEKKLEREQKRCAS